ncbi:MAG: Brp/Blh family beta-carotene 15,15'-dioxygenase, partial [Bacteroidota bacterium]
KSFGLLSSIVWGSVILIAPMILDFHEVSFFIATITEVELPIFDSYLRFGIPLFLLVCAFGNLVFHFKRKRIEKQGVINMLSFLAIIMLLHLLLDFIVAFTLYFVFFHSLNAFKHQYHWLKSHTENYSVKRFIKDLAGFGLLAVVGIILILVVIQPENQTSLITLFFILVSLITLPHAITLDQFYKAKPNSQLS